MLAMPIEFGRVGSRKLVRKFLKRGESRLQELRRDEKLMRV